MILFQTTKGDPTIRVKLSLCATSHTAAKTPSSVAALSSGFSAPCSGSRIYTPYRCPCHRLPAFGSACFWVSFHCPRAGTVPHYKLMYPGAVIQTKILSQLDFLLYWISVNCYILVADNKEWLFHYSRTVTHLLLSIISIQELLLMNLYFWFSYISFQRLKSDCLP